MSTPRVLHTIDEVRAACDMGRRAGGSVGLVPTMGYFHAGHRSLMRAARGADDLVVVSLFVNPTQFGPNEDLAAYPRDIEGDTKVAGEEGVDVLFTPSFDEMYPEPGVTTFHVGELAAGLCGARRPGHFDGVTTVVTKLFSIVGPCRAYFGRKDAQQLAVVARMARDLDLPVEVVGCPLVREPDGVAMSSRNAYLTVEERAAATVLSRALRAAADEIVAGERAAPPVVQRLRERISEEPLVALDYAELVDAATLAPVERIERDALLALAAFVGKARLLDNLAITVVGDAVSIDLGVVAEDS
jgi:pantoate--beta-alanine ligase